MQTIVILFTTLFYFPLWLTWVTLLHISNSQPSHSGKTSINLWVVSHFPCILTVYKRRPESVSLVTQEHIFLWDAKLRMKQAQLFDSADIQRPWKRLKMNFLQISTTHSLLISTSLALLRSQLDHVVYSENCDCCLCCKFKTLNFADWWFQNTCFLVITYFSLNQIQTNPEKKIKGKVLTLT